MRTQMVKIGKDVYELTAVTCDVSGAISIELLSNMAPLIIAFMEGDIELVNRELRTSVNADKLMRMLTELINPKILTVNNELVIDWKEHFACKPLTLFKLGWEALRFNCEDFFTFISGFAKENNLGQNWNEIIKSLKSEGVEIPPVFSLLLQNGEVETEEKTQK